MTYAVRVQDDYVGLMGRHVVQGQSVAPGAPLVDIMTPEGIVETIISDGWGVVAHIEGGRIFPGANSNDERAADDDEDDDETGESGSARGSSGGKGVVFARGDLICHIMARSDNNSIKGGRPHPSTSKSISNAKAEGRHIPTFG